MWIPPVNIQTRKSCSPATITRTTRSAPEISVALHELSAQHGKLYFQYDHRKKGLRCPQCLEQRNGDDECRFAQKQTDGQIRCIACLSVYAKDAYAEAVVKYFGYLDEPERARIAAELRHDLR